MVYSEVNDCYSQSHMKFIADIQSVWGLSSELCKSWNIITTSWREGLLRSVWNKHSTSTSSIRLVSLRYVVRFYVTLLAVPKVCVLLFGYNQHRSQIISVCFSVYFPSTVLRYCTYFLYTTVFNSFTLFFYRNIPSLLSPGSVVWNKITRTETNNI